MKIRYLYLATLLFVTACISPSYNPYTTNNNSIGEITDWKMELIPEPGQLSVTMQLAYKSSAMISLNATSGNGPLNVILSSTDCGSGHQVAIQYFTSRTESKFKYFKLSASSDDSATINVDWGEDGQFSVSLNSETIKVKANTFINTAHIKSSNGTINIKNLQYIKKTT